MLLPLLLAPNVSNAKPARLMIPTPAKHVPANKIIFANLPSSTSNPRLGRLVVVEPDAEVSEVRLRCESEIEMGVERMLPIPRVAMYMPRRVEERVGLLSAFKFGFQLTSA